MTTRRQLRKAMKTTSEQTPELPRRKSREKSRGRNTAVLQGDCIRIFVKGLNPAASMANLLPIVSHFGEVSTACIESNGKETWAAIEILEGAERSEWGIFHDGRLRLEMKRLRPEKSVQAPCDDSEPRGNANHKQSV